MDNIPRLQTLSQIGDAMDAVDDARDVKGLSAKDKQTLDTTMLTLRNLQRTVTKSLVGDLVAALKNDSTALADLTAQLTKSAKKLDTLTTVLQKTTQIIAGLVNVVTAAAGAGFI
jgi:lambda repressor-like predicted transcriptional regulator